MASTTEKTYGSRLANAQKLAVHLADFISYAPATPECSLANYQTLLDAIITANATLSTANAIFTTQADTRQQLFKTTPNSMLKRLSPISAYTKALYGKNSKEAEMVVSIVNKLRGEKTDKIKKDTEGEWVSQSQRSYGSMTQNFANLIDILTNFGTTYAPTNSLIKPDKLQELLEQLTTSTNDVTTAYGKLKIQQDKRAEQYEDLTNRSTRIKETIKSIYGNASTEYKLIKGLKI